MKTRLLSAALPAFLVLAVAGATVAARDDTDAVDPPLHAMRPAAASTLPQAADEVAFEHDLDEAFVATYLNDLYTLAAATYVEAQQAAEAAAAATGRSSGSSGGSSGTDGGFLECTKARESGGDYGAVSSGGTYRGAYQFHQGTWDSTAAHAGRGDLVGQDPSAAAAGDQDAMAQHLYEWQGASHWGGRCG